MMRPLLVLTAIVTAVHALTMEEESLMYGVTLTRDGVAYVLEANGLPDHDTDDFPTDYNPNSIETQNYTYRVSIDPVPLAGGMNEGGCLPMGVVGFTVNGVPMYNPYTGMGFNAVEGDNRELFDDCNGHPDPGGSYHYHMRPSCLLNSLFGDRQDGEVFLGVALDGYPIYATYDGEQSELDICNGKMVNDTYRYYATYTFPYLIGCYIGTVVEDSVINFMPPPHDDMPQANGDMPDGDRPPTDGDRPPTDGDRPPPDGDRPPPDGDMPEPNGGSNCYYAFEDSPNGFADIQDGDVNDGLSLVSVDGGASIAFFNSLSLVAVGCLTKLMFL